MPFSIIEGDISQVQADAVVNAANEQLLAGGGVCGSIFAGAGYEQMQAACDAIGYCPTGNAVVTPGFGLSARFVIHAVGPVWRGGSHNEEALLRSAYRRALLRAAEVGAHSVAFPLISAGIYGYPQDAARRVATEEIRAFLAVHDDMEVMLCLYSREQFAWTLARYQDVAGFVDAVTRRAQLAQDGAAQSAAVFEAECCAAAEPSFSREEPGPETTTEAEEAPRFFDDGRASGAPSGAAAPSRRQGAAPLVAPSAAPAPVGRRAAATGRRAGAGYAASAAGQAAGQAAAPAAGRTAAPTPAESQRSASRDLTWRLAHLDASFSATVLALIDERGLTDAEVYKRANLSRQVFSKLRKDDGYRPAKQTAVALALALELDLEQTEDLLQRAGYALSRTNKFDVIVEYYIEKRNYDVFELNEMLFAFDQPLLGSL